MKLNDILKPKAKKSAKKDETAELADEKTTKKTTKKATEKKVTEKKVTEKKATEKKPAEKKAPAKRVSKEKVEEQPAPTPTVQNVELGILMQKAAEEPAFRKPFYERFLNENVHVVIHGEKMPTGTLDTTKVKSLAMMTLPDGRVPIFTSPQRIVERGFVKGDNIQYLTLTGRDLITSNANKTFVINPFSDYARNITPDEIPHILDGTALFDASRTTNIPQTEKVELGMPKVYPGEALKDLIALFRDYPEVTEAYIAIIRHPGVNHTPNYLFAVRTDEETYRELSAEMGITIGKHMLKTQIFEVMRLDGKTHFEQFFAKVPPFYKIGMN